MGLDRVDIKYLEGVINRFKGGPVGIESLASAIGEEAVPLEDVVEPYLLKIGFINRTQKGRMANDKAIMNLEILKHKRKELEKWQQRERINQVREKIKIHMVLEPVWQQRVDVRFYLDVVLRVERYYLLNKVSKETFLLGI